MRTPRPGEERGPVLEKRPHLPEQNRPPAGAGLSIVHEAAIAHRQPIGNAYAEEAPPPSVLASGGDRNARKSGDVTSLTRQKGRNVVTYKTRTADTDIGW